MKIPASKLSQNLKNSLLRCYLVTGDEPLLVQEALDLIRRKARTEGFGSRDLHIATTPDTWSVSSPAW